MRGSRKEEKVPKGVQTVERKSQPEVVKVGILQDSVTKSREKVPRKKRTCVGGGEKSGARARMSRATEQQEDLDRPAAKPGATHFHLFLRLLPACFMNHVVRKIGK